MRLNVDAFAEQGAGVLDLRTPRRRLSSQRSILGVRARTLGRSIGGATLEVRAAWAHEFSPLSAARMQFVGDTAGNAFELTSPARIHNSAVLGANLVGKAFKRVKFITSVDGDLSGRIKVWTASAGLRAAW